jgi:hypothetical protein
MLIALLAPSAVNEGIQLTNWVQLLTVNLLVLMYGRISPIGDW